MLEQGTTAPDFTLPDQSGESHSLSDFRNHWVILYFYPKDLTSGCTTEACNFRDDFPNFQKLDTTILGISKDSVKSHAKFAEKYKLPFLLLSDESSDVCEKYGVWQEKSMYGKKYMGIVRTTVVIDENGKVMKVFPKVKVKGHVGEVLNILGENK